MRDDALSESDLDDVITAPLYRTSRSKNDDESRLESIFGSQAPNEERSVDVLRGYLISMLIRFASPLTTVAIYYDFK